jgi:hypothetical protein
MGQKMVRFGALRGTRSRQDESIEVGEVGSKRPSLGGNGGHFAWWGGLICALSRVAKAVELEKLNSSVKLAGIRNRRAV